MTSPQKSLDPIYRLVMWVLGTRPVVWRRMEISSAVSLAHLDLVLRRALGWRGRLGHRFVEAGAVELLDREMCVADALPAVGARLRATCEGEEGWSHEILLEAVLPTTAGLRYPRWIDGECAAPPEECGGPWGYEELLEALGDPEDPEHEAASTLLGRGFDPLVAPPDIPVPAENEGLDLRELMLRLSAAPFSTLWMERGLLAYGEKAVYALGELLLGPSPVSSTTAAFLLAEIGSERAGLALLGAFLRVDPDAELFALLGALLSGFGSALLEPLLRAFDALIDDEPRRQGLREILSALDVEDDRIYGILVSAFDEDLVAGATALARYGHPRGLEVLEPALEALVSRPGDDPEDREALVELGAAFEALGGRLRPALAERIAAINAELSLEECVKVQPETSAPADALGRGRGAASR